MFLNSRLQRGILPQMLEEILNTRIMVKQSMKKHAKVGWGGGQELVRQAEIRHTGTAHSDAVTLNEQQGYGSAEFG